jgi:drug/metabolite transporter (DMT)-like permease
MSRRDAHRLEATLLLFAAGGCLGLIFPLGRLAGETGIPPLLYAGASAAGASLVLALLAAVARRAIAVDAAVLRYAVIAGQLTFAIPFGVLVLTIPHLGSGIPAILQSLAPIFTLAIVYALGLERPNPLRAAGLATGLAGALVILVTRNAGDLTAAAPFGWYLAALVTPLALAAGNVYRSVDWPAGQHALPLAAITLAAAAAGIFLLIGLGALAGYSVEPGDMRAGWRLIALQSLATGIGYAFFFRLQQVGGPVYLSQISYVNTGVGMAFALLFFGEPLSFWAWLAVLLVFLGVALVNRTHAPSRPQAAAEPKSY